MKNKETRKKEALERDKQHNLLSAKQKLLKLDLRFGDNKGAKKERARLALEIKAEANTIQNNKNKEDGKTKSRSGKTLQAKK